MRISESNIFPVIALALLGFQAGCPAPSPSPQEQPVETPASAPGASDHHQAGADHQGPHGGRVIDLGRSHEFHAEIVEDHANRAVTVYVLGPDLKEKPIEQQAMRLSLIDQGKSQVFELQPVDATDGRASQFRSSTDEPFAALHERGAAGKLLVTIEGKSHSGTIEGDGEANHSHD